VHYAEKALLLPFSHHPSDKHHFEELLPNQERLTKEDTPRGIFEMTAVNRILKLDAVTLSVWTQAVLRMVEVSPLLSLLAPAEARDNLLQQIQARGVQRRQMRLLERLAPQAHLQRLATTPDVALETRLVGGGSTVLDVAWSTVPISSTVGAAMGCRFAAAAMHAQLFGNSPRGSRGQLPPGIAHNIKAQEDVLVHWGSAE